MACSSARPTARRRLSWLVCLGLLFAFAQSAVHAHAISHFGKDSRSPDGAVHAAQCDLCVLGATVGGAVPPADHAPPPIAAAAHVLAAPPADRVRAAAPAAAYRSRAPPSVPR